MTSRFLTVSSLPQSKLLFGHGANSNVGRSGFKPLLSQRRRLPMAFPLNGRRYLLPPRSTPSLVLSSSLQTQTWTQGPASEQGSCRGGESSILLDVSGMMCGGCVSRVRSVLSSNERVESAAVNMLTETAVINLEPEVTAEAGFAAAIVADSLARRLTECGFSSKRRVSGAGVAENVRKWKEMLKKKEELLVRSRNRVIFAWTLVALCCGSHASHLLHSFGIHVAHGSFFELLHNSYLKGGLALSALLGPGRDLLFDGLKALRKGSPNMNSLVGFGSLAAFAISAVSLLNPELQRDASFFDEPSLISTQSRLVITSSESESSAKNVLCSDSICVEVPTDDI